MAQKTPSVEVPIDGMNCANCALGIERHLRSLGLTDSTVSITTESAFVSPTSDLPLDRIKSEIRSLGYTLPSARSETSTAGNESGAKPSFSIHGAISDFLDSGAAVLVAAIFTAPFLLHMLLDISILHEPALQAFCASVACMIGLAKFIPSAIGSLKARVPNMEVLISIGIIASLSYSFYGWRIGESEFFGFFESAATISSLVLLGNWLEHRVSNQARSAITELARLQPSTATRVRDGIRESVPTKLLEIGDIVAVNTGDKFPCDGIVTSGTCLVDESIATGESVPQRRSESGNVIAGTTINQGSVLYRVTARESESFVATMVNLVKRAQTEKPPIARIADKIAAVFVPMILAISLSTLIGALFFGLSLTDSITRAVAVLVIACPCALGLATPAAVMIGIAKGAKHNVLFRSGVSVEALAGIQAIAFDKTGTLTTREPIVSIHSASDRYSTDFIKSVARTLELHSSHPVGQRIAEQCADAPELDFIDISERVGVGVSGAGRDGTKYFIGQDANHRENTVVSINGEVVGIVKINESLRSGAADAMNYFSAQRIKTLIVSGDSQARCEALNLSKSTSILGGRSPAQKQQEIVNLNKKVAFIGDGVNDAPVLASATVGISLGEASSVAINTADVVIIGSSLSPLVTAHRLAKATLSTIRQNLFWAFSYNIVAVPVAMAGLLSPSWAALAMGFSDVVLIINSLRLQFKRIN